MTNALAIRTPDATTDTPVGAPIVAVPLARISRDKPGHITAPTLHWGGHPTLVVALIAGAPITLGLLIIISLIITG